MKEQIATGLNRPHVKFNVGNPQCICQGLIIAVANRGMGARYLGMM
jgi:hypothetical protein